MTNPIFSFLPIEVAMDDRLTKIEIRVLVALYSFRGRNTNLVWPSREAISERCGYMPRTISKAITSLKNHGWLNVKQHRGPNTYELIVPDMEQTVPEPGTVPEPDTVPEPGTNSARTGNLNSARTGAETVPEPGTPELTKELTIGTNQRTNQNARANNGDLFEQFWSAYPKKVGKVAARNAWRKLKQPTATLGDILGALAWQTESSQWRKDGGQFIPNPATYLNQGRWMDEKQERTQTLSDAGEETRRNLEQWLRAG